MIFLCPNCRNQIEISEAYTTEIRMGVFCASCGQLIKVLFQIEALSLYDKESREIKSSGNKTGSSIPGINAGPTAAIPATSVNDQISQLESSPMKGAGSTSDNLVEVIKKWAAEKEINLPVLPEIKKKVNSFSFFPEPKWNELIKLVQTDQVLATLIIRMSNSFSPANQGKIDSISDAARILGVKRIHKAMQHAANLPINSSSKLVQNGLLKKLWTYNLACAMGSKWLATQLNMENRERIFLLGLLFDIGKTIILQILSDLKAEQPDYPLPKKQVTALLNNYHPVIGADVLTAWNFPQHIVDTIRKHHDRTNDPTIQLLQITDLLSQKLGLGLKQNNTITLESLLSNSSLDVDKVLLAHMEVEMENLMMRISRLL